MESTKTGTAAMPAPAMITGQSMVYAPWSLLKPTGSVSRSGEKST